MRTLLEKISLNKLLLIVNSIAVYILIEKKMSQILSHPISLAKLIKTASTNILTYLI